MARQMRLVIPALAHLVQWRALRGVDPYPTPADRREFLSVLCDSASGLALQVHAFALRPDGVLALATPGRQESLGRWLQAVGRRYVSGYNRRHGRSGTLWAGRFRSAAIQPGAWTLKALRFVDGAVADPMAGSASQRCGGARLEWPLTDPPEYWALGNTPFDRQTVYAALLADALPTQDSSRLGRCLDGGWVCGDEPFLSQLAQQAPRAPGPRPRGRPARTMPTH